jgi:uncharacterized protein (TIGR03435 family)
MSMHKHSTKLLFCLLLAATGTGTLQSRAQEAGPPPPPPHFDLPPVTHSVRAVHTGPSLIMAQQPNFPAEIVLSNHNDKDWLESTKITSRTHAEIMTAQMGWAYVLPSGLEFHAGEVFTPAGGVATGESFQAPPQAADPRADAKDFIAFVEQTTFADGTISNADHAEIAALYTVCCTGVNAGKVLMPPEPALRDRKIPGGPSAGGPGGVTAGLKPFTFDIVSFRKSAGRGPGREMPADGDFIAYHGSTIESLLLFAYGGTTKGFFLISGQPDWAKNDYYEFVAKVAPEDVANFKKITLTDKRLMVQAALEQALKLKVHKDTDEHPVYNLVVAKSGSKLMDYQPGDTVKSPGGQILSGKVLIWFDPFNLTCQDTTIPELVNSISGPDRAGKVVIDKTGLTGAYDFTVPIPYRPLPAQFQQMAEDSGVPSFLSGLKQLGLQLEAGKGQIQGIVIDHIEKPETNDQ